jgi:hypothetical protein
MWFLPKPKAIMKIDELRGLNRLDLDPSVCTAAKVSRSGLCLTYLFVCIFAKNNCKMAKITFREWTVEKLEKTFGLQQIKTHPLLTQLYAYVYELTASEREYLLKLQRNYVDFGGEDWNEVELENKFISPLIVYSEIDSKEFAYFLERELAATIGDYELYGKVDGMIATGFRSPQIPYFCLHEYKRESDPSGDPRGQTLAAMLAAQTSNDNQKPIYGLYIVGGKWRFCILEGTQYAFGKSYLADDEDIFEIYRVLKGLRFAIAQLI